MNTKIIITSLFFLSFGLLNAQTDIFTNYKPIECQGEIPASLVTSFSEVIDNEIDEYIKADSKVTQNDKKDFLESTTHVTKKVLLSGNVLYNDPVTNYINKVADKIFETNPKLNRKDFQFYAYKSPIVNAIAFDNGLVLVNLGLIAQLENEAQLAFVLCHEITHFVNHDAIDFFLETKEMERGSGSYENVSYNDKMLYRSKYSQEIESTADLQGLEYFKNTVYSLKTIGGVFDVLKYAYLPFDEIAFDTTYFDEKEYFLPSEYKLTAINPISPDGMEEDDEEDILKSHPEAEDRRIAAFEEISLSELKDETKKVFLASSEDEFLKVRNICRFEMPRMYLLNGYYEMAFYNAYLLENQGFKNNLYLDQMKAKAIGQMTRMVNTGNSPSSSYLKEIKNDLQGEVQQVYYMLNSLARNEKELNIFAVKYAYEMHLAHPKDEMLKDNFENLAFQLFKETNIKFSDFSKMSAKSIEKIASDTTVAVTEEIEKIDEERLEKEKLMAETREQNSKYSKIEKKVEKEDAIIENAEIEEESFDVLDENSTSKKESKKKNLYYLKAFDSFMNDSYFLKTLKSKEEDAKEKELDNKSEKQIAKENKLNRKRGYALDIDKIAVINPFFYFYISSEPDAVKSEQGQLDLEESLDKVAKKSKLEVNIINSNKGNILSTEAFNQTAILNEWITEQFLFDEPLGYSSIEPDKMNALQKTYDTRYFLWTGVIQNKLKRSSRTYFYSLLIDIETGKAKLEKEKSLIGVASKTLMKSELYAIFQQINFKR